MQFAAEYLMRRGFFVVGKFPLETHGESEGYAMDIMSKHVPHHRTRPGNDDRISAAIEFQANAE